MKYHWTWKVLAIVLICVSVVGIVAGGICTAYNVSYGLYYRSPEEVHEQEMQNHSWNYASTVAENYAYDQDPIPKEIWIEYFSNGYLTDYQWVEPDYQIFDENGALLKDTTGSQEKYLEEYEQVIDINTGEAEYLAMYWEDVAQEDLDPQCVIEDTGFGVYQIRQTGQVAYRVRMFYTAEDLDRLDIYMVRSPLGPVLYENRISSLILLSISIFVAIGGLVYLACAAGRKPGTDEIRPGGMNRIPLDLYFCGACFCGFWPVWALVGVVDAMADVELLQSEAFLLLCISFVALCLLIGLICCLFWTALCAQVKVGSLYWLKNTLIGRCWNGFWGLVGRILGGIWRWILKKMGKLGEAGSSLPKFGDVVRQTVGLLPLMWQWLLGALLALLFMSIIGSQSYKGVYMVLFWIFALVCCAGIFWAARSFGMLRDGAKRMSQGNLDAKIPTNEMDGCFGDFAEDLNALGDACVVAAREQLKSERMKTELITNVSHDIKTPLTSIINYVDLLKMAQDEQQREEYLEVLSRQSQQLKKLIEDLMELSKASSGNITAEVTPTDVREAITQALGEFSDRLDGKNLNVVFKAPEEPVMARCDGKLLWRVMSNVLGNVVKYAMPGTRVYVDLVQGDYRVEISLKNISAEPLNITAEELMERFVRGDASRNTEGNGLGLNIAKSLMEVQSGTLDLVVDGDLFKVILTLPRCE